MTVPTSNANQNLLEQAYHDFTRGELTSAIEKCRSFLKKFPNHADAWQILGVACYRIRDLETAQQALEKSLALKPEIAETLNTLGCVFKDSKQWARSEQALLHSVKLKPNYANAWFNLGLCYKEQNKLENAAEALDKTIAIDPTYLKAYINLAQIMYAVNNTPQAIGYFQRALVISPEDLDTRFELASLLYAIKEYDVAKTLTQGLTNSRPDNINFQLLLGNIYLRLNDNEQAIAIYLSILETAPTNPYALNNLASALEDKNETKEAIKYYRQAIASNPNFPDAYSNLGRALADKGDLEEAEAILCKGLKLDPNFVGLYINYGLTLSRLHRHDEAKKIISQGLAITNKNPTLFYNYGNVCQELGELQEAIKYYRQALALDPEHPNAQTNLGMAYLTLGDFKQGWPYYFKRPRILLLESDKLHPFSQNMDLQGKHVFLLKAQGIGDEIQFLRFVKLLKGKGARITYRADKKLKSLASQLPYIDNLVTVDEEVSDADYVLSVDDLPLLLEIDSIEKLPPPITLKPNPALRLQLASRLKQLGPPPYIAVTWRGGTPPTTRGKEKVRYLSKEFPLERFSEIIGDIKGTYIAVQRNPRPDEISDLEKSLGQTVHDLCGLNDNLEEMLAFLDLIDVYVGVSNTNMHLVASLGKFAYVLIPSPTEWRWMDSGSTSPWFPDFKVYRQIYTGSWDEAITNAAADIKTDLAK